MEGAKTDINVVGPLPLSLAKIRMRWKTQMYSNKQSRDHTGRKYEFVSFSKRCLCRMNTVNWPWAHLIGHGNVIDAQPQSIVSVVFNSYYGHEDPPCAVRNTHSKEYVSIRLSILLSPLVGIRDQPICAIIYAVESVVHTSMRQKRYSTK